MQVKIANESEKQQYFKLRDFNFKDRCGWDKKDFSKPNQFDDEGIIFVCCVGDKVVAGCRLMLFQENVLMSNESETFRYKDFTDKKYCEINDIVCDYNYRGKIIDNLVQFVVSHAKQMNQEILMTVQDYNRCRLYKILLSKLGLESILDKKNKWEALPEYNYSEDYLMITKL
jgi:hypothetical protein